MKEPIKILSIPYVVIPNSDMELCGVSAGGEWTTINVVRGDYWFACKAACKLIQSCSTTPLVAFINSSNELFFLPGDGYNSYLSEFVIKRKCELNIESYIKYFKNDKFKFVI